MKKAFTATVYVCVLLLCMVSVASATALNQQIEKAMKILDLKKGSPDLLVMTNAPYVTDNGASALPHLDQAQTLTGATVGKGNLLFFQRPQSHPLRLMLFSKKDGNAVIISRIDRTWSSETVYLDSDAISRPDFWQSAKKYKAGKDLFTLAAMANVWARGGPYDFLKSAELHNHICPGLTSGYLMAHYILNRYPLGSGERYTMIACPVWCKEDALQVVLDCTPGKKGLIVKQLSKEQQAAVAIKNPAGILLIWNAEKKTGKGVALSFDFDRLRVLSPENTPKAAMVLAAVDHLATPERFVSTAAEFDLDQPLFNAIIQAGGNPYALAGLVKK